MKKYFLPVVIAFLLLTGCIHKAPLSTEHSIAVDWELLGLWEPVPGDAEGDPADEQMLILPWSETEYVAHFPRGENGAFYRVYPVEIGGRLLLQAQSLGSSWGEVYEGDRVDYPVLDYRIVEGILMVSTLNPRVVDEKITDSEDLREALLANINKQDLFEPPAHFRRVEQ